MAHVFHVIWTNQLQDIQGISENSFRSSDAYMFFNDFDLVLNSEIRRGTDERF